MSDQEMPEAWQLRAEEKRFEELVKFHAMLQTANEERVARLGNTPLAATPEFMQAFTLSQVKLRLDHLTDYLMPPEVGDELSASRLNFEIAFEQTMALMLDTLLDQATEKRLVVPK